MPDRKRTRGGERIDPRPRPPRGHRRLVIRGREWLWRHGDVIRIVSPEGVSTAVALTDFTGLGWDDLERAQWKGCVTPITPRDVRDHIDRRILGYADAAGFPKGSAEAGRTETPGRGWRPVEGPRGAWHWRCDPCDVEVMSPEGVVVTTRVNRVIGMTTDEWIGAKMADLTESGLTLRDFDISRRMDDFMLRPVAAIPAPTDAQVAAFIRDVVTAPAKREAA